MSEFSDSFHFREQPRRSLSAVRTSGLRGIAFPPRNGWRTFVPFDADKHVGADLSTAIADRVLHYVYAEDHGWGFEVWEDGARVCAYTCDWSREEVIIDERELRFDVVAPWLQSEAAAGDLAEVLRTASAPSGLDQPPAYRFARALGLRWFKWLGPQTVTADVETLMRRRGVSAIGVPPAPTQYETPPVSRLDLATTEISARDALGLLLPHVLGWAPDVRVYSVCSAGAVREEDERGTRGPWIHASGRSASHGGWCVSFASENKRLWTHIVLRATGEVEARSGPMAASGRYAALPAHWLDSPAVLGISETVIRERVGGVTAPLFDRFVRVHSADGKAEWSVLYIWSAPLVGSERTDIHCRIDAETGALLGLTYDAAV